MEWKENPQLGDTMLSMIAEDMKLDKPLPHVTELIYCLTRSYYDRFDYIPLAPKEVVLFSIGVELGKGLLRKHRQEVDGVLDGIHFSIDFMGLSSEVDTPAEQGVLGELKSTRQSPKKDPRDFPDTWRQQLLAYMKANNSLEAIYTVIYVQPAVLKTWEVTATQQEVDENWDWMKERRETYMDFISKGEPPTPFKYNKEWECKYCRYRIVCDAAVMEQPEKPVVSIAGI